MRLSTKGRYAVMAMVDLARHGNGRPLSLADIAERQEISLSYLEQLFAKLRRAGLVASVRGPGGGYLLARDATETRISDIILAVDEPIRATRCHPSTAVGCHSDKSRCLTHDLWDELGNQIHLYLSSVSLDDVVNRRILGSSRVFAPPRAVEDDTGGREGTGPGDGATPPDRREPLAAE
ncbi:MAG: Rrf2 family transcriptional regulator [Azospirillaceae bacterium]